MAVWEIFETVTGDVVRTVDPQSGSWTQTLNDPDTLTAKFDLNDPAVAAVDWRNAATPWKFSLCANEAGKIIGGPITSQSYDNDSKILTVQATGIEALLKRRIIKSALAWFQPLVDPSNELPRPALDVTYAGTDLGTIIRDLVSDTINSGEPGAFLPIIFEGARVGTRTRSYTAVDLKTVAAAIEDIMGSEKGPDMRFDLIEHPTETLKYQWRLFTGSEAKPRLANPVEHPFEVQGDNAASALSIDIDPSGIGSVAWGTSGRSSDKVLAGMRRLDTLVDAGFPLLELTNTSHQDVVIQSTLDGHLDEQLRTSQAPVEFWSFRHQLHAAPYLQELIPGDYCTVRVLGDPFIVDGTYSRRIVAISGDEGQQSIEITCGGFYG